MKSHSNVRPAVFHSLGDGSYHYNHNISKVKMQEDGKTKTFYEYNTVHVWGTPTYAKCVKAVLRENRDETEEFSLINKYNAFVLGLSDDVNDKAEYEAYLREVLNVKAMVKADFENSAK